MSTGVFMILCQSEGTRGPDSVGVNVVVTPEGLPMMGPLSPEMRAYAASLAAEFPGVKYTVCELVPVHNVTNVH